MCWIGGSKGGGRKAVLPVEDEDGETGHSEEAGEEEEGEGGVGERNEGRVVGAGDAGVYPSAVMIKMLNAQITAKTVP